MKIALFVVVLAALAPESAMAHPGHGEEPVGFGQWIAIGVAALVAGIAAWLMRPGRNGSGAGDSDGDET